MVWNGLATSENGGSAILGYDLWRDDGDEGDFNRLSNSDVSMALSYTDRTPRQSLVYRYKYRARNVNGWGAFSDVGYLYAADVPLKS